MAIMSAQCLTNITKKIKVTYGDFNCLTAEELAILFDRYLTKIKPEELTLTGAKLKPVYKNSCYPNTFKKTNLTNNT